jgi:hypothetical protein
VLRLVLVALLVALLVVLVLVLVLLVVLLLLLLLLLLLVRLDHLLLRNRLLFLLHLLFFSPQQSPVEHEQRLQEQ